MKGKIMNIFIHLLLPLLFGVVVAVIVFAALAGKDLPLIHTPRACLIALLVIGLTMCFLGGVGQLGSNGHWTSPVALIGSLIGSMILIIIIGALAGWKLPLIFGESQAIAAVGILMGIKCLIGAASFFFHWL